MTSIHTRFMHSYLVTIFAVFLIPSVIAFYYVNKAIEVHSSQTLHVLASQKTAELNECFGSVEGAVGALESYISTTIDMSRLGTDSSYNDELKAKFLNEANQLCCVLKYVKTFYYCLELEGKPYSCSSYFVSNGRNRFIDVDFDIKKFDESDVEHTNWFYTAKSVGRASWIGPYLNANVEDSICSISYAIPIYYDGNFIGVVGMDIGISSLRKIIDNLDYDMAFGFLVSQDDNLIYHKDFPKGLSSSDFGNFKDVLELSNFFSDQYIDTNQNYPYKWYGVRQRLIVDSIDNGMLLAISVPESELLRLLSKMIFQMSVFFLIILIISVIFANNLSSKILRPVRIITESASRIARGELNTDVPFHSDNELGALAESIRKISVELKEYIGLISKQAYSDVMTSCGNKAAYIDRVKVIEQRINENIADFAVFVFDVNGLKRMNDRMGHEYGDMLIKDSAGVLRSVFSEESIFRTGGDEFVVLEENITKQKVAYLLELFDSRIEEFNKGNDRYEAELAISKGAAVFDKLSDKDYKSVFARADEAMYDCKEAYYKTHEDQRRK